MAMTYASLLVELPVLVDNDPATDDAFAASLAGIVERAERRISRELNLAIFHRELTGTLTIGNPSIERPANIVAGVLIQITLPTDEKVTLAWRPLSWLREWWPTPTVTGQPRYIAVQDDNHFEVAPPPDLAYSWRYAHRRHNDFLSDGNQSNVITVHIPDLLLYAAACEAAIWAQEDRRDALRVTYEEAYQRLKAAIIAGEQSMAVPESDAGAHVAQEPKPNE
jgi:hypothetical protein